MFQLTHFRQIQGAPNLFLHRKSYSECSLSLFHKYLHTSLIRPVSADPQFNSSGFILTAEWISQCRCVPNRRPLIWQIRSPPHSGVNTVRIINTGQILYKQQRDSWLKVPLSSMFNLSPFFFFFFCTVNIWVNWLYRTSFERRDCMWWKEDWGSHERFSIWCGKWTGSHSPAERWTCEDMSE